MITKSSASGCPLVAHCADASSEYANRQCWGPGKADADALFSVHVRRNGCNMRPDQYAVKNVTRRTLNIPSRVRAPKHKPKPTKKASRWNIAKSTPKQGLYEKYTPSTHRGRSAASCTSRKEGVYSLRRA